MEGNAAKPYRRRILFSIMMPALLVAVLSGVISSYLITPPILVHIKRGIDFQLHHSTHMALEICEYHLNYLLDLRLEDDAEMNEALRKEAAEEIKRAAELFGDIDLMILDSRGTVIASSVDLGSESISPMTEITDEVHAHYIGSRKVRTFHVFFPFWDWHLMSFIHESDYLAPFTRAKVIIYTGTFGVLAAVWLVLLLVANRTISKPLKQLGDATRKVAQGDLSPIAIVRPDEIGQVTESFNVMVDNLKRKDEEVSELIHALTESEKRYRSLFTYAAEGILVAELDSLRFIYANPAICEMLGYTEEELEELPLWSIHPKKEHAGVEASLNMQRGGKPIVASEVPCLKSDGSTIYVDIRATPISIGETACTLAFFSDVTARRIAAAEKKELEQRLHVSEKMEAIGMLAGGVAHDLNNILSGLVSYPELLLLDLPQDSPLRGPIQTIEKSGLRAAAIVQDLLTLARRGVAVAKVTSLNRIVTEYLHSIEHENLEKYHPNTTFKVDLSEGLLPIIGSPVHLAKSIMNLVSNAAEATDSAGGTIHISTRNFYVDRPIRGYDEVAEGDYAVLSVTDDGIGIAQDDLKRIFEPFYSKKVMGRSGTGLGMAVVWGTIKDHNGYIDVYSTKNKGTTFDLYFPVTREPEPAEMETQRTEELMGSGERVLVIDDIAEQREIATRILTRLGYNAVAAPSGEAALEYLESDQVDLLVLDMIMDPGIDGLTAYRRIIELRPGQKAVIASGYSENDRVREALKLGASSYVRKPYTMESIGSAVKDALNP